MLVVAPITRRIATILAIGATGLACFDTPAEGLPCDPPACPLGQACVAGRCTSDVPIDASVGGDGPEADAAPCSDGDGDGDGVCDVDDTWPCGVLPAPVLADVRVSIMGAMIVLGTSELVALTPITTAGPRAFVVNRGAALQLEASYLIGDCACPSCLDQIEFGLVPGGKQGCLYAGNPGTCTAPTTGRLAFTVAAPMAPGRHDLRIGLGQDVACGLGSSWWADLEPGDAATIAHLCVR
ncbi:MAG: hypothetical protein KBG28_31315 [Kofleriaceae bacterium]|jgi:hypothetical protein|nr:hypothetical protein [Kofleriaceae bacterium]MBP9208500.1 hypothetical protein [Kofleriaceae bacterium]